MPHATCHILWRVTRSREQASGAGEPCAAICPDTSPGAPLILFKNTGAVAADDRAGQRHRAIAGVSMNYCFTDTYVVCGAKNISEYF